MKTARSLPAILLVACVAFAGADDVKTEVAKIKTVRTFKNLRVKLPVLIDHAGDGSNRLFIASQVGKIYVMKEDPKTEDPKVFMDIEKRVRYLDRENEEGLLGLAFHPHFKKNGFLFVYYTQYQKTGKLPRTSIISRFSVSPTNPDEVDPKSEKVILKISQPFWNHNGGTICFGPDGYLYVGLGDGGAGNDPMGNGQNLSTWLGSILRIDIDHPAEGKNYSIPKDNPFTNHKNARPEIYAYGLRNVWRMTFDRQTGMGYVADVGQDFWEEVNILQKGGNYGWNLRESRHDFAKAPRKPKPNEKFVEPIWEYDHATGKSITGGVVYRGKKHKELQGMYLFADYVTGFVWGLQYDPQKKQVTRHLEIRGVHKDKSKEKAAPVITFGESESGEVYFSDRNGRIFTFGH
jgi:glucose/arabinose dehydrogenase